VIEVGEIYADKMARTHILAIPPIIQGRPVYRFRLHRDRL